jgi:LysM repeat protein
MIERVSRYYDGPVAQTKNKSTGQYNISVFRAFPKSKSTNFIDYTWKDGDTLSLVAENFGVGAKYWWEIMDINPTIMDPMDILPGTVIRIPYGS